MTGIDAIASHDVLPAEVLGDTLIVTPHGDLLSHDPREYRAELERLVRVVKTPGIHNLIVDLSGSDYFGSQMLGGLVTLKSALDEDGRAVLCELSESQRIGLRTMRLEDEFEIMPTRQTAVRKIPRLSAADYIRRFRRPAAALLLLGLIWGLYESRVAYRVFGSRVADHYESVAALWSQYQDGAPRHLTSEERIKWEIQLKEEIAAARDALGGRQWYLTRDASSLGNATVALDDLVNRRSERNPFYRFRASMAMARYRLQQRTGLEPTDLKLFRSDKAQPPAASTIGDTGAVVQPLTREAELLPVAAALPDDHAA